MRHQKLQNSIVVMKKLTDWNSRPRPARVTLEGAFCRLEPLNPIAHGNQLFEASMAPGAEDRFRYLFDSPQDRAGFGGWLARAAASVDPRFYAGSDASAHASEGR